MMQDIFDQFDGYKGDLDTSNPYTIEAMFRLEDMKPEAMEDVGESFAGGAVAGTVGLPGFGEQLARGAGKASLTGQQNILQTLGAFANTIGLENVGNAINTLYGSEQNRNALEVLLEGLTEETVLPAYDDVKEYLQDKGVSFDNEGAEIIGELLAPAGYIKYGKKAITGVTDAVKKGMGSAKKSFNIPSTVYHGTDKQFDTFQNASGGIYFTDNPNQAKKFGKNMKEVQLKLENPYVIDDFRFDSGMGEKFEIWKNKIKRMLGSKDYGRAMKSNAWSVYPDTIKRLQDKGYDGIAIPSSVSSSGDNRYIVFDSSQIEIKGK